MFGPGTSANFSGSGIDWGFLGAISGRKNFDSLKQEKLRELDIVNKQNAMIQNNIAQNEAAAQGVSEYDAGAWLGVADAAAERWWGQGSYFADFGGSPGVVGAASGLVQGAVDAVRAVGDGIVSGIARGLGIPRWIMWGIFGLGALLLGWFLVRVYLPRARRAF